MLSVYQRIIDVGKGDCLKCCVASLLELRYEDVPNFIEYHNGDWLYALLRFLVNFNLYPIMLKREESLYQHVNYIAIGRSPRSLTEPFYNHAVIMNGNKLVHDPHPSGDGILDIKYIVLFQPIDLGLYAKNKN